MACSGYQPPEYIDKGEISGKFDIFSLGVLIIKMVSGSKGYPDCLDQAQRDWKNRLQTTCTDDLFEAYCHQVDTCSQIAMSCVETDSFRRPDIVTITENLNEIEIHVGELPEKGCHITISRMAMHNSKIEMRTESTDITDQHQNIILRSDHSCNELELHDVLETSPDTVEEHIVGRTEEKDKVMASLLEAMSEKIVILPIHGIGGIGKTTFARLIYNDPKFYCYSQVWVHVSQRFDSNKIYKSITLQLSGKECLDNERQKIHSCLNKLFAGKKILIVLDDLWDDHQFRLEELKNTVYHKDSNIIILVTTRSELVAERICTNVQSHKILPLTNDMCWDIIKQRSCFKDRNDKEQLMGIGQEIARKCGGVALAALSLGFTLRSMNFEEWMKVKDSDIWNRPVSNDFSVPNQVLASLKLSYSYMSPCLKACFTYCATFAKGHKIVKDDLIYQWIALDFIKPTRLLSNVQHCEKYILQLLALSFFQQPVSPKTSEAYYEQATFFTMHDLVHDLAISLLGNQILDETKQRKTRGSSCQYALLTDCSRPLELCLTSPARLVALHFLEGYRSKLSGAAFAPARSLQVWI
ncbi:putative disease resistance protein RGA3 [Panicum virgatum]|uniref:putative disease resistance protein RGA3 n=1 Tax=Panicum virgatum TaxID=38727 RepID=UPI0019D673FB|nr:putative disease resistance protein RGA3 [Panicum virgatum]